MAKSKRPVLIADKLRLKRIPTELVHLPGRPGRHDSTYEEGKFSELCYSVGTTGGNVTPIVVRPRIVDGVEDGYVLVSGERRLVACHEAGVKVWASIVSNDNDAGLLDILSLLENSCATDYCAYEFGQICQYVLDQKRFRNQTELAQAIGRSESLVSQSLAVASLPDEVVEVFASVADVQHRFAKPLKKALREDREAVLARAKSASDNLPEDCKPQQVVAYLCGKLQDGTEAAAKSPEEDEPKSSTVEEIVLIEAPLIASGATIGILKITERGNIRVDFETGFSQLGVDIHEDVKSAIEAVVGRLLPAGAQAIRADAKAPEIAAAL